VRSKADEMASLI